jgi:enoyl-CoA hydratase
VIHVDWRDAVVVVTIDRPFRRNAVDHEALVAIRAAIDDARAKEARALVLTGAGGTFCAGADLNGVEGSEFAVAVRATLDGLTEMPAVTIAAVEGAALGAGTQLAAACDLRVATPGSRFGIPAARLGLVVDRWTVLRMVELVGGGTARAMLLAAETIDGEEAQRLGFVQRLGGLDDAVEWAVAIAALAPLTVSGHKTILERPDDAAAISDARARAWSSHDAAEGRRAFLEKRPARFTGH